MHAGLDNLLILKIYTLSTLQPVRDQEACHMTQQGDHSGGPEDLPLDPMFCTILMPRFMMYHFHIQQQPGQHSYMCPNELRSITTFFWEFASTMRILIPTSCTYVMPSSTCANRTCLALQAGAEYAPCGLVHLGGKIQTVQFKVLKCY